MTCIRSKRHKRCRSPKDCEYGLPYTEVVEGGKRRSTCENLEWSFSSLYFPLKNDVIHSGVLKRAPFLLKFVPSLLNLPSYYAPVEENVVEKISLDTLIIGGGVSGLSALEGLSNSIVVAMDLNDQVFFDPLADSSLIKKLKEIAKSSWEKVIKGVVLGRFEEGIVIKTDNKLLVVNANKVIVSNGGRYIPPIFKGNDLPGIISRNLYLRLRSKLKRVIVVGSSDDALRTAMVSGGKLLVKKGTESFSKFWSERAEEMGVEVIQVDTLQLKRKGKKLVVYSDGINEEVDAVVFAVIKQPRIELMSNLGVRYKFYSFSHVYLPEHDYAGLADHEIAVAGGSRGISDYEVSFLSSKALLDDRYLDQLKSGLKERETHLLNFYSGVWESRNSPYLFSYGGYVCECEDVTFHDLEKARLRGYKSVEEVKRVTGLSTGSCQGKICTYLAGSYLKSDELITFRSPLYPMW
ncbi:MAG: BFD (2Fe-2S)-binding domain-containing protein [Candidatus Aramenus sulfurataquae]|jgi:sarcosine oxidase subunit alpha|uniref:(2Fe-2S)-binding protein n=2 Tax=Candidatus Aramenus sulfurataquae TaxID=1326980 RepID=W7KJ49_9CREN|nr:MAG: BFD (2Fe-2S)-binding domain-containing protein [Candidatus Aramenus sulfurataquae]MCL7343254.1 (2Fe-2S)-binding protein [Candidatus Aramenus sulfurataquae]